jgi:hypothetical protein
MSSDNWGWVERRYNRDKNLERAEGLWQEASAEIQADCKRFNILYASRGTTQAHPSQERLIITVQDTGFPVPSRVATATVQFNAASRSITSRVEKGEASGDASYDKNFLIDADESHVFITYEGKEVSLDEFSRLAIEIALFKPTLPKRA